MMLLVMLLVILILDLKKKYCVVYKMLTFIAILSDGLMLVCQSSAVKKLFHLIHSTTPHLLDHRER